MDGSIGLGDEDSGDHNSEASFGGSLDRSDLEAEVAKQKAIIESLNVAEGKTPPWNAKAVDNQSPLGVVPQSLPGQGSLGSQGPTPAATALSLEKGFKKRAKPPSEAVLKKLKGLDDGEVETAKANEVQAVFGKRAKPPADPEKAKTTTAPELKSGIPSGRPTDLTSKEVSELEKFTKKAKSLYSKLDDHGVKMDLAELVEKENGYLDHERFQAHTTPNRAATGLRYARLLEAHFRWLRVIDNPFEGRENAFEKLNVLGYMEYVIHRNAGARTPQSILYAVDFFGKAFGFEVAGSHFNRAKRLSLRYAQANKGERVGAPMFTRATLVALETILLDEGAPITHRVTAGKLRLCVQSSIRHSDLNNTPIACCEWVRRRGEVDVVGLRAKAHRGKTGPRAWVASVHAADEANDQWMPTLMKLLLEAHGPGYTVHDHFGRLPNAEGNGFHGHPSSLEADVIVVKLALAAFQKKGGETGLTPEQVESLRWHGAKATLTSVMQHLNLSPKVIRFSGDWKDSKEAMPDVYLREAQLMVLRGQERALAFLRKGGDIGGLIGEPVFKEVPEGKTNADLHRCDTAMVDQVLGKSGQSPVYFSTEFMDDLLRGTSDIPDLEMLEKERESVQNDSEAASLLGDGSQSEKEVEPRGANAKAAEDGGKPDEGSEESDDEVDDYEGMVQVFAQVKKPTPTSRIHRNREVNQGRYYDTEALPMSGAKGSYDYIKATEAMDSELCIRCFGRSAGCSYLCGKTVTSKEGVVRRCARRCTCEGSHDEHRCHMHAFEETV